MTSPEWQNDDALFAMIRRELFTAVVGDVLDNQGYTRQFLPPNIRPLRNNMVVLGRAMPVLVADYFSYRTEGHNPVANQPFGLLFQALDDLKPNEVYLATGGSPTYALWGELLSTRAIQLKASGAVLDGYSRDTRGILAMDFPTFSYGPYAQDQGARGKVVDWRVPVEIGQVRIEPGDIVFGDIDGVLVIPHAQETVVITAALEKARTENQVKKALEAGMSTLDAFDQFGVM